MLRIKDWLNGLAYRWKKVWSLRVLVWNIRYGLYNWLRRAAIPLFGGVLILTVGMGLFTYRKKMNYVPQNLHYANTQPFYVGLATYTPKSIADLSPSFPPVIPHHLSWSVTPQSAIQLPPQSALTNQLPLLYIEPVGMESDPEVAMHTFFTDIIQGKRDAALTRFATEAHTYGRPMFASFVPEFDNPTRSWGVAKTANLILYRQAWQYVIRFCRRKNAGNITWIWCPFMPSSVVGHYPGNDFVDWLGFAVTNDPRQDRDGKNHSFAALFQLSHAAVRIHAAYSIRQKPILITRMVSVGNPSDINQWTNEALELMRERYPFIRGVILSDEQQWYVHRKLLTAMPFRQSKSIY